MYGRKYSLTEYRGLTQKVSGRNDKVVVRQKRLLERSLSKSDDHLRGARRQFWLSRILTRSDASTGNQSLFSVAQMEVCMKLRNIEGEYSIGLDLGTGSVGWAVISEDGELLHFNGKPAWGSRIFPSADTAAETRLKRGQRRRYERRRWRLDLLQGLFEDEMNQVDSEFFIRLRQSRLIREDRPVEHREYHSPLFSSADAECAYYDRFPTIYHLRAWLMTTNEKADLREIYLALHNIVKHRGNFLHQDNPGLSATAAGMRESVEALCEALEDRCICLDMSCNCDVDAIVKTLEDQSTSRAGKRESLKVHFGFAKNDEKAVGNQLAGAFLGYKVDFSKILGAEFEDSSFSLSDDEKVDAALAAIPDEITGLFEAIRGVYSAYILSGILNVSDDFPIESGTLHNVTGKTISFCKVREFEQYKQDLALLKSLVRTYARDEYDSFFRGELLADTNDYDPSKAKGYTKYDLVHSRTGYDAFFKDVKNLLDGTDAVKDDRYKRMLERFNEERFLRRLKTSDNGSIPYQLHLEEMDAILKNQGRFFPFLLEDLEKIESLVSFRIPYYVGPLTQKNAALDGSGKPRFAWAERKPGMEDERVYPWNWEEVIDKNKAAHTFIRRMTSTCTYLMQEDVLARNSLLYEEFCVLNELNGARWSVDGDDWRRFDYVDRTGIVDDLFRQKRSVTFKMVEDWMREKRHWTHVHVKGGQGEGKFESGLPAYRFFCKDVFKVDELPETMVPMVETIILWSTLFEDRSILKEELERNFSDRLSAEQIKVICKKRFTGWGNLSERLLVGLKAKTDDGLRSIMDILREGNPTGGVQGRSMVFMEILHDERFGFEKLIEQENAEALSHRRQLEVEDLPGSPALRRTVNQAVRIVEEIARIAGKAPKNVFVETTRDEDERNKGKRTKRRYDAIKEAVGVFKSQNADLEKELKEYKASDFDDERLVLYFMQGGKSLYSGNSLDIRMLSAYQIDHIIPQSYIKDDSFENKALVLASENQEKTDSLLLSPSIRAKMAGYWKALHDCKLIGDKKFENLMCSNIGDRRIKGFIARQLVETSQIVKLTKMVLESHIPETRVVPVRASLSHELREAKHYVKCREINDFHHAHDALLAAEIGRFLLLRHAAMYDNPIGHTKVVKDFVRSQAIEAKRMGRLPGSAGFFISSFLQSGFDRETGEVFRDSWDAEFECERIRRYLNYRQVFLSRMPYIQSGQFWDANPVPRSGKTMLPIKEGLDPRVYGGYATKSSAYFFIAKVRDKRDVPRLIMLQLPVYFVPTVEKDCNMLEAYAIQAAKDAGYTFDSIVCRRIMQDQLVEVSGSRLWVSGIEDMKPAGQLSFSLEEANALVSLQNDEQVSMLGLFDLICERLEKAGCTLLADNLNLRNYREGFKALSLEKQKQLILDLVQLTRGDRKSKPVDLSGLGGPKAAGRLRPARAKVPECFCIIDQSVTGMFEKRTHIGL